MKNSRIYLAGIMVEQHRAIQEIAVILGDIIDILRNNPGGLTLRQEKMLRDMRERLNRTLEKNGPAVDNGTRSRAS